MIHLRLQLAAGSSLLLAAVCLAQRGHGGPTDTPVTVVLPHAGDLGCGTLSSEACRLVGDESNVYSTSENEGVNSILFGEDGNLSLQFPGTGKGKSAAFPREVAVDLSHPNLPLTGPLPDLNTLEPDYLFAAPDNGEGLNCILPDRPCNGFGTFGTVTGTWDKVRLAYRFAAKTTAGEERYWSLEWYDLDDGRFAHIDCIEASSGQCLVWRVTADVATLRSSGRANDVQPTGDFEMATQFVVCRDGVPLSQGSCEVYLTTSP